MSKRKGKRQVTEVTSNICLRCPDDNYRSLLASFSPVVDEGVHEYLLLDDPLELWLLVDEVAVVVVGDDHGLGLRRQVEDELVVVADDAAAAHLPRRRERQQALPLQLGQQVLVCKTRGRSCSETGHVRGSRSS